MITPRLRVSLILIALIVVSGYLPIPTQWREWLRQRREITDKCKHVLFIGNSLTFVYDMPGIVAQLSHSLGANQHICPFREAYPGVTLQWHFEAGHANERLSERKWDYVVLQEQSGRSFEEPVLLERWIDYAVKRAERAGATPLLYSISSKNWGDQAQAELDQRMIAIAAKTGALLVPVNRLWQKALSLDPSLRIYGSDNHHPGLFGAYLAAALFVNAIDHQIPIKWPTRLLSQPEEFREVFFPQQLSLEQAEIEQLAKIFDQFAN